MRPTHTLVRPIAALVLVALASAPGCITITPVPPPEAVLAGTWKLTTAQSTDLVQTLFTFDARGQLDQVSYKVGGNVTITNNAVLAKTSVDGENVTIISAFVGNSIIFNGTLNADQTVITGTTGTEIKLGGITISIDNGAMTLTRQ